MARRRYIPDRGDFIWIDLDPRLGHEQAGRRPAIVLSPKSYNRKTGRLFDRFTRPAVLLDVLSLHSSRW